MVDGVHVPADIFVQAFADNVPVLNCGQNMEALRASVLWDLGQIEAWVAEADLELIPTKSVVVLFSKSPSVDIDPPRNLTVCGVELKYYSKARYLGVFLNRKLNFCFQKIATARRHILLLQ